MEWLLEHRSDLDGYLLYAFSRPLQGGRVAASIRDSRLIHETSPTPPGTEIRPALFLRHDELEALRRALIGEAIDSDDALRDTRAVRDRLLALIERLVP
jgi:hypothetical protein